MRGVAALVLLALVASTAHGQAGEPEPEEIERVHVVFMNHLDVGFSGGTNYPELLGYASQVIDLYLNAYFPKAINASRTLREEGSEDAFVYTTKGWLVSMMMDCPAGFGFECPDAAAVADFERAVADGDITWHAFPFNTEMEYMDKSMLEFSLRLVHDLDDKFGVRRKRVVSQRDVPGTTIASLPLLAAGGIEAITFGVNGASATPDVPREFLWRSTGPCVALMHVYPCILTRTQGRYHVGRFRHVQLWRLRRSRSRPELRACARLQ